MRSGIAILLHAAVIFATAPTLLCGEPAQDQKQIEAQARYRQWERQVPSGSKLAQLKPLLERKYAILPTGDLEDRSPFPMWFRVYMRLVHPDLRTSGPDQYGRNANRVLQALLDEPNEPDLDELINRLRTDR